MLIDRQRAPRGSQRQRDEQAADHLGHQGLGGENADLRPRLHEEHGVGLQRQRAARDVGHGHHPGATAPGLADRRQGVGGLPRLGDGDDQAVLIDQRVAVAELAGVLDLAAQPGELSDGGRGVEPGDPCRSHPDHPDVIQSGDRLRVEEAVEVDLAGGVDAAAQRVPHRLRLLVDLLEHEVRVAALLGLLDVPVDLDGPRDHGDAVEIGDQEPVGGAGDHLVVTDQGDPAGVGDQGGDVAAEEDLALAGRGHQGRVAAGADQGAGFVHADHHQGVGALDPAQRRPRRGGQITVVELLDEVGEHLGVGVAAELVAACDQLGAQLPVVLDDPVVDQLDAAVAVLVRMGVHHRGPAVGGPAGVADPEMPGGDPVLLAAGDQVGHLAIALDHAVVPAIGPVEDRDPGRVVTAVLEALEALQQQRGGGATTGVADDAAHQQARRSCPRPRRGTGFLTSQGPTPPALQRLRLVTRVSGLGAPGWAWGTV